VALARSSFLFALGTIISRISGVIRDIAVAFLLGAGPLNDAYVVAQRIPNLLRDMLAEGALGSSFTKVYTAVRTEDQERAERLLFQMLYLGFLVMCGLILLGIWAAPWLVDLMSLGATTPPEFQKNASTMTRILFPSLGMTVLGAVAMGALYEKGRFFTNAVIPVLANVGIVIGGFCLGQVFEWFAPELVAEAGGPRALGLAWGNLLGFFMQMAAALWGVRQSLRGRWRTLLPRWPWNLDIGGVLRLMAPAAIASSAGPINAIVNTNFATSVGPGAVSWLNYAFRLLQLPIGIFGVAVGISALPMLTRAVARAGQRADSEVSRQLQYALDLVTWLLGPCLVYTLVNHQEIIRLLFRVGRYTDADVAATGQALFAYSFGMLGYGWIKVLSSFYYATNRTAYAMKVSLFGIVLNFVGNWMIVRHFGHVGLAMTSSLTLTLNALFLLLGTRTSQVRWQTRQALRSVAYLVGAALLSASCQLALCALFEPWLHGTGWSGRLYLFLFLGLQGLVVVLGFGVAALLHWRLSWTDLRNKILSRKDPSAPV